eukprot:3207890-Pleurochrysis_carterae.AAC.2
MVAGRMLLAGPENEHFTMHASLVNHSLLSCNVNGASRKESARFKRVVSQNHGILKEKQKVETLTESRGRVED